MRPPTAGKLSNNINLTNSIQLPWTCLVLKNKPKKPDKKQPNQSNPPLLFLSPSFINLCFNSGIHFV